MENKNTRIQKACEEINHEGRKVLIAYITAGYPSLQSLGPIVKALEDGGANMAQIGIPFLDPVGDAPVVQILSKRAIENGFTVEEFFLIPTEPFLLWQKAVHSNICIFLKK